ncbi:MAG: hypothetical protein M1838_003068 [Thelocarpon superellum]|nr:MAG: hypothetical protein M1838_003068 [Thelocarpon superellum]
MANPGDKSYLSAGLGGLSPWGAKASTAKASTMTGPDAAAAAPASDSAPAVQQGGDHALNPRHRLDPKSYPRDCPPLNARWFYAVDVPKRKPLPLAQPAADAKPAPPPKKFVAFSPRDSRAVELAFQKLADDHDACRHPPVAAADEPDPEGRVKVPVNEDNLFDVDIERRELAPVYWLGPIYEVRRGTWFYQEGSTLRTCDENLATQLEEGYLKVKPFRFPLQVSSPTSHARSSSVPASHDLGELAPTQPGLRHQASADSLHEVPPAPPSEKSAGTREATSAPAAHLPTHRLFGAHINSVVTYQDGTTAWILTDDFLSRMSSTMYQRFAGGGHLGGVKVVRGYSEPGKTKESKGDGDASADGSAAETSASEDGASVSEALDDAPRRDGKTSRRQRAKAARAMAQSDRRRQALERTMSDMVNAAEAEDPAQQAEEARRRDEKEMQDDYRGEDSEEQNRDIEHVVLVTHGIGQRLGLRMESVNFVHDVNVLRKTLKAVYASSADLQALNSEVERLPKNCRVQVLPVCWRHLLDFPKQRHRAARKEHEHDLGELPSLPEEEDIYPSLDDITVEGVPAVRNLITDLALDILLYQSSYREHIAGIVQHECNRIYRLFLARNPHFQGQVSLVGHSLGSAILFDILCDQGTTSERRDPQRDLDFDAVNFFCLGSPIGLFQMLRGRTVAGRASTGTPARRGPFDGEFLDDPFLGDAGGTATRQKRKSAPTTSSRTPVPVTVSAPKCGQLFNIFHPTDPISYRIEPLISPAMAPLKPQPLPYTKKGIFGAPMGQGLTGIGARVGQSVSGLWTSFSSGIANTILHRSLGLTPDDGRGIPRPGTPGSSGPVSVALSAGAGTNIVGSGVLAPEDERERADEGKKRQVAQDALEAGQAGQHPPTLIDAEMETLYAGFEKRRKSQQSDGARDLGESAEWQAAERRGRRLRHEEAKVRALNSTGRVDFSIQEGVFDITLIASIASHLSYWGDEDVSHFMLSQLLSRHGVLQRSRSARVPSSTRPRPGV